MALFGLVFVAVTLIVLGDTAGKLLTAGGIAPGFIAWTRFAVAAVLLAPFMGLGRADSVALRDPLVWLRAALICGGIVSILTALQTAPMADAFGAFFIGPLVSTVLAIIFLRERPGPLRLMLLLAGFAGVLLVVRPGGGMVPGLGFAVLAGCFYGGFLAVSRQVAQRIRPRLLLFSQLALGAAFLTPLGLGTFPSSLPPAGIWLILGSALGSAAGNYLLVRANRIAAASQIAPLIYLQLVSATVLGLVVFGTFPDAVALVGMAVIAATGVGSVLVRR